MPLRDYNRKVGALFSRREADVAQLKESENTIKGFQSYFAIIHALYCYGDFTMQLLAFLLMEWGERIEKSLEWESK